MVNALFPRDLAAGGSRFGNGLRTHFSRHSSKRRVAAAAGVVAAGLGVFGVIALGLPSTPQSQTLSALSAALDKSEPALIETLTFADRFAADVKDLPPTIGVAASVPNNPLAVRLAEYRAATGGSASEPAPGEGIGVIPQGQPRATETTTSTSARAGHASAPCRVRVAEKRWTSPYGKSSGLPPFLQLDGCVRSRP